MFTNMSENLCLGKSHLARLKSMKKLFTCDKKFPFSIKSYFQINLTAYHMIKIGPSHSFQKISNVDPQLCSLCLFVRRLSIKVIWKSLCLPQRIKKLPKSGKMGEIMLTNGVIIISFLIKCRIFTVFTHSDFKISFAIIGGILAAILKFINNRRT